VLGFDDQMSTDHDWRARVLLFLREKDETRIGKAVADSLRRELPPMFREWPVDLEIHTVRGYSLERLGVDVYGESAARDWLAFPEQSLRMFTSGTVHHDELDLQAVRDQLASYPRDVWLYLLVTGASIRRPTSWAEQALSGMSSARR
jgi:hypothetical protein